MVRVVVLIISLFVWVSSGIAQPAGEWKAGRYYDLENKRYDGYVYYDYHSFKVKFWETLHSKTLKLKPWKIKGFVVEQDTFTILKDFYYEVAGGARTNEVMDFVQVLDTGTVVLYKHYANQNIPMASTSSTRLIIKQELVNFLITSRRTTSPMLVRKNPKKFKNQMMAYFSEYPEIVTELEIGAYGWEDMPEIVKSFNHLIRDRYK